MQVHSSQAGCRMIGQKFQQEYASKEEQRRIKNRHSAQFSREKRRLELEELNKKVEMLTMENSILREYNRNLQGAMRKLAGMRTGSLSGLKADQSESEVLEVSLMWRRFGPFAILIHFLISQAHHLELFLLEMILMKISNPMKLFKIYNKIFLEGSNLDFSQIYLQDHLLDLIRDFPVPILFKCLQEPLLADKIPWFSPHPPPIT